MYRRGLCIDAIERAHSLDPTNASHSERLQYYQDCRDDEQGSLEESGETLDDEESSSRSRTSSRSFGQRTGVHPLVSHAAQEAGSNKYTPGPLENHQDGNQMHIASMALRTADVGPVQETFADEHDNRHELDDDPDSDTTLAEPIYQVNPQLDHARVSQSQSPVSSRSASPIDSTAGIASAYARTTEHLHPSRASRSQEGEDLRLARNDDPSDLSQAQIPDVRIDAHAHLPSTDHLNGAQDDEQWKEEPGVEHYDRSAVHSAPPHHLPRQRAVSGANQRATSASPQVPHQHEYSPIEPRVLLHTLQQYHEAIQHTNGRLAAVESDVQRNTEELAERSYANERQLHEQYSPLCQRLSQTEETLTRHDEELRAIRASLDRIAARFDDMEARRAGTRAPLQNRNHDEHPAISSSPRNTRIAIQPITSTPQPRSRPTSMVFEAEQRARSVPPMQTGHSSVAGHSDDPPPSFHSRVDEAYGTRSMHDNTRFQPYFGAGESFDTFDKQAILERGMRIYQGLAKSNRS